jgi:hypothetical protein
MIGIWDVFCRGKPVGTCRVTREGLYYRFSCRCAGLEPKLYLLTASVGEQSHTLGTVVPEGDALRLETRVPVKRFSGSAPSFRLEEKGCREQTRFVPLEEGRGVPCLDRLLECRLAVLDGRVGLLLPEQKASP